MKNKTGSSAGVYLESVEQLANLIFEGASGCPRFIVGLAGPPASGKSTMAALLSETINQKFGNSASVVVPMDGFHYDNAIIEPLGLLPRKGAPETFDVAGFSSLLKRLSADQNGCVESPVSIPVFDRELDLSRASARMVCESHSIIIAEGNYLLLDQPPWLEIQKRLNVSIRLDVPIAVLQTRLIERWLSYDHTLEQAKLRAEENDLPNARLVMQGSVNADYLISSC